jgi:hypothetical protein
MKFPSSLVKRFRRIGVETRLKGYKYFEIEAFELFLDIVEWFDKDESRQMRYSPSTLQIFWLGRKLFGGRFIQLLSCLYFHQDSKRKHFVDLR